MVIFHSYVKLPEGNHCWPLLIIWGIHEIVQTPGFGNELLLVHRIVSACGQQDSKIDADTSFYLSWNGEGTNSGFGWRRTLLAYKKCNSGKKHHFPNMSMDQYLLIPFLGGWTSIYQLFWCSPGVQGFDTLPHQGTSTTKRPLLAPMLISGLKRMEPLAPPRSPIAVWEATLGWAQYMGGSCRVPQ